MLIDSVLVPYGQHGVGQGPQVPLRASLPPSITLPTYPSVAAYSSLSDSVTTPDVHPTIDIPIEQLSSGQTPTLLASSTGGPSNVSSTPMKGQKPAIAAAGTFFGLFTVSQIHQHVLFPKLTLASKQAEEKKWVASSHSWLDRKACNWFGLCGLSHPNEAGWSTSETRISSAQVDEEGKVDLDQFWKDVNAKPDDWSKEERRLREVPNYVLEHAPYIHLYSGEEYWPGDISEHLIHTTPHLNYTPLQASSDHPNLTNLNELNRWGFHVFLQSDDNVEDHPDWLAGESNIPNVPDDSDPDRSGAVPIPTKSPQGDDSVHEDQDFWQSELRLRKGRHEVRRLTGKKAVGGRSEAPAVLIVVEKEDGVVDAFWFFFYSYNLGNTVFNVRFGNHVGDWEHTVVRFQHGKPKAVFFSEHSFGEAYHWDAVEKIGNRPVGYSATGTHAMYGTPGVHPYVLPGGILHDVTDRGPLWDPTLNMYSYTYDVEKDVLRSSNLHPQAPTNWFYFAGHWGDKSYPLSDKRQYQFVGQYHYVSGPLGPRFKNLGRNRVCPGNDECLLKKSLRPSRNMPVKRFPDLGEGEGMTEEDKRRFFGSERDGAQI